MNFLRDRATRWLLIVSLVLTARALADITLPSPASAPVQAIPRAVRIWRGGEAEIFLAGRQRGTGALQFTIRDAPKHGRLSEIRAGANDTAIVTYSHDVSQPAGTDGFTFIAETSSGEKSAAAEVRIVIEEPPPRLRVPDEIDFGEVMAGKVATETLAIANEGGGVLEGKLRASAPWKLSAEGFRVPSGETQIVKVTFQSAEPKAYVGQIALTGAVEAVVSLKAKALAPLTASPNPVRLALTPDAADVRTGTVELTNRTEEMLTLKIKPSRYLKTMDTLEIPAYETRPVPIGAFADYPPAIKEEIEIAATAFTVRVLVEADGLPAKVRIVSPAKVELPDAAPGETRSAKVLLRNDGGRETAIRITARAPFRVAPAAISAESAKAGFRSAGTAIFLPAQEEAEVEVRFSSDIPGQYATLLTLVSDSGKIEMPLSAQVIAPEPKKPMEFVASPAAPTVTPPAMPMPPPAGEEIVNSEVELAGLEQIEVRAVSQTEVELKWPRPNNPPFGYRIEQRKLTLDTRDELKESWEQLREVRMTEFGQTVSARIRGLKSAFVYGLRVSAIDRQGAITLQSPVLGVATFGSEPRNWGGKLLLVLLFSALVAIGYQRWRMSHA